jgi:hypothetical protein
VNRFSVLTDTWRDYEADHMTTTDGVLCLWAPIEAAYPDKALHVFAPGHWKEVSATVLRHGEEP